MRSSRELMLVAALAACGTEYSPDEPGEGTPPPNVIEVEPDACETSYLDYETFGAPFVSNWCRGCHSSELPAGMRQRAPMMVNFDSVDDVRTWKLRIAARAATVDASMPPAGGPSLEERTLLAEWLACGAL